jgi:AraC family L-rhamnose operon regulatory protein RhaS
LDLLREGTILFNRSLASAGQTVELFWKEIQQSPDYMAHPWTVHEMARECGMGVTQFATVSKRLANLTPVEQLNRCRVEAAADMLRVESSRNVTNVALACGFSSGQYFAKVFRQLKGCSPTEYRQGVLGTR